MLLVVFERQAGAGLQPRQRRVGRHVDGFRRALGRALDQRAQPHEAGPQRVVFEGRLPWHRDRDHAGLLKAFGAVAEHSRRRQRLPRISRAEITPRRVAGLQHLRRGGGADVDLEQQREVRRRLHVLDAEIERRLPFDLRDQASGRPRAGPRGAERTGDQH